MNEALQRSTADELAPRISVIVPTYRRSDFVLRAVQSVRVQTIEDWELIIVDDNDPTSSDRMATQAAVEGLLADPRVRYVRHDANKGGSAARNTGIRHARAPFIAFLDDDDEWASQKLDLQLARIQLAPPKVALVYCQIRIINTETGRQRMFRSDGRSHSVHDLLRRNTIGSTSSILCRATALHDVGLFDESLPARQDLDLYLRLAEKYEFAFIDEPLVTLYLHGRPSIGKDARSSVIAHERFAYKHRALIASDPDRLRLVRYQLGSHLVAAEQYSEARSVLMKAWRAKPTDTDVMVRLMMTYGPTRRAASYVKWALHRLRRPR